MTKINLTEFYADWCPFCQTQNKILDELEKELNGKIEFYRIDIYDDKGLLNGFEIEATPTIYILKDNTIFKEFVGLTEKDELINVINNAMAS